MTGGAEPNPLYPARRWVLFVAGIGSFLTPFMGSSVNIALPAIGRSFALRASDLSWIVLAYMLAAAVFLVPFGRLADIIGRRRVFVTGVALDTVFSLLGSLAPSHLVLTICRAGQGIGGAMIFSTGTALLTAAYPPAERGRVLGINVAAVYTGLSLGPVLGGLLTHHLGWRSVFMVNAPLAALAFVTALTRIPADRPQARHERFDLPGVLIYALSLVGLMFGLARLPGPPGMVLVPLGLVGIAGFLLWESRTPSPVLNVGLFRGNRVFLFSNLAALVNYSANAATGYMLSFYLQHGKGLTPAGAGLVLVAQPVMQALFSPLAGRFSDRIAARTIASLGMALSVIGLALLALLRLGTPFTLLVAALLLLGLAFALFSSPNTSAIMGAVEPRYYGVASGTLATMRQVGQMLSIGIVTVIFASYAPGQPINPTTYSRFLEGTRLAFAVFAALCLLGVFASLARGRGSSPPAQH